MIPKSGSRFSDQIMRRKNKRNGPLLAQRAAGPFDANRPTLRGTPSDDPIKDQG
jgi:hypothetical protein